MRQRGRGRRFQVLASLALLIVAVAAPAQEPPLDSLAQRVKPCAAGHGEQGRATSEGFFPRIAGKPAGYLHHQLLNFRDGRRLNAQMSYMTQRQDEAYLREIAEYFSGLSLPYPPPAPTTADAAQLQRGAQLATQGDAARNVPACQDCHGERLTGVAPDVPGLLGLPYDYLVSQFGAWRTGNRRAEAPDCMGEIARRLRAEDVAAVAGWLAAQPMPADTHPASGFVQKPSLDCGGIRGLEGATR